MSTQGPGSHWLDQVRMKRTFAMSKSLSAVPWEELSAPMTGASLDRHSRHCRGTEDGKRYCANLWKIQPAIVTFSIFYLFISSVNLAFSKSVMFPQVSLPLFKKFFPPRMISSSSLPIKIYFPQGPQNGVGWGWLTWSDLLPKNILLAGWCGEQIKVKPDVVPLSSFDWGVGIWSINSPEQIQVSQYILDT